jgi:DUF917 family protein
MNDDIQTFDRQDLEDLLDSVVFYASGGGGPKKTARSILEAILEISDRVPYVEPEALASDRWAPVLAAMGSPDYFDKYGFTHAPLASFEIHEEVLAKDLFSRGHDSDFRFSYAAPVESGALAHFMSMLVAVQRKVAVVDGDGGGRAFPSLAMSTYAAQGVPVSPGALASEAKLEDGGTNLVYQQQSASAIDDLTRAVIGTAEFNNVSSLSSFAMDGTTTARVVVPHTLTRARDLGRALRESPGDALDIALEMSGGTLLFQGVVTSITSVTSGGFDHGVVTIENDHGDTATVVNENENLIAWSSTRDRPLAMAPDSICYLGWEGETMSNVELAEKQWVSLVGVPAVPQIRIPYFLEIFGQTLATMGYYGPYVPLADLVQEEQT